MNKKEKIIDDKMQRGSGGKKKLQEISGNGRATYKGMKQRKGKWMRRMRMREVGVADKKTGGGGVDPNMANVGVGCLKFHSAAREAREEQEVKMGKAENNTYWDEEEVFNMPAIIDSMAEGLIITPPALQTGFNWLPPQTSFDFTLWQH